MIWQKVRGKNLGRSPYYDLFFSFWCLDFNLYRFNHPTPIMFQQEGTHGILVNFILCGCQNPMALISWH